MAKSLRHVDETEQLEEVEESTNRRNYKIKRRGMRLPLTETSATIHGVLEGFPL